MKLTKTDVLELAAARNVPAALLHTICHVEAPNGGHLADGRPVILFEGHKFYRHLPVSMRAGIAKTQSDICYPKWTKQHYVGGAGEHKRLARAAAIDREAALKSASWGRPQIMGENYAAAGFESLQEFVNCMYGPERGHINALITFIRSWDKQHMALLAIPHYAGNTPLEKGADLVRRCRAFVSCYNGPGYAQNDYHRKFAKEYLKQIGDKTTVIV